MAYTASQPGQTRSGYKLSLLVGSKDSSDVPRSLPSTTDVTDSKSLKKVVQPNARAMIQLLHLSFLTKSYFKDCGMSISVINI